VYKPILHDLIARLGIGFENEEGNEKVEKKWNNSDHINMILMILLKLVISI